MRVILAFDSFKGCVTAEEACAAARGGILRVLPHADLVSLPLADGGEGTSRIIARALDADPVSCSTVDAIGRPINATYYIARDVAVIEIAAASGLALIPPSLRDPLRADTYGTGLLILDALRRGATHIILTLGGSATTDGAQGILRALGGGRTRFSLVCDVRNPFCGEHGAAFVYAPQKGATAEQVLQLDRRLQSIARQVRRDTGIDISDIPGAGAAGGVAGVLHAVFNAPIISGIDAVLDALRFDTLLPRTDLIITGEGSVDCQSLMGKTVSGLLRRAGGRRIAVLAGRVADREALMNAGLWQVRGIHPHPLPEAQAMEPGLTLRHISRAAAEIALLSLAQTEK